jgi:hypothetical protein
VWNKNSENFSEEIQDIILLQELRVHTWISRRSITESIMNNFFMVKAPKIAKANDINKDQGIRLDGERSTKEESKQTQPLLTKRKIHVVGKKLCWELAAKAQSMVDEANLEQNINDETKDDPKCLKILDIWEDANCLNGQNGQLLDSVSTEEMCKVKKRV